ncbi:hypothetical protein SAMN05421874_15311 [Nonomuraea maritima]|uniref:Uncharacterized protein n=1 Tax=Nonomuraea maritima TaxID=683260 RepID=A0A1G9S7L6_9ACTN|nr:hypothetical protein [Nonomuraea maritima]SDM31459.1 hypothetical protein SAMN05421874_15311 [Nonomuraea maritima]
MSERYTNVARDGARVGAQIGKSVGDVTIESTRLKDDDLSGLLAELRMAMRGSVVSGELAADVHNEAEAELSEVDSYLEHDDKEGDEERRRRMVLALKKVRGLLADVAGLASIAGAILAAGQGLN